MRCRRIAISASLRNGHRYLRVREFGGDGQVANYFPIQQDGYLLTKLALPEFVDDPESGRCGLKLCRACGWRGVGVFGQQA